MPNTPLTLWLEFTGGTRHGRRFPMPRTPAPGAKVESKDTGEQWYYDPMSGKFILRWPPLGFQPIFKEVLDVRDRA